MSDYIARESGKGMVNTNYCFCSLESLDSAVEQSSFTSNDVFDVAYALAREKRFEVLSPLPVEVVRYSEMMRICAD